MIKWVSRGQTVKQQHYIEVLRMFNERVRKGKVSRETTVESNNASVHIVLSVKKFLADKCITVLEYSPYLPDDTQYDFYKFLKVKDVLLGAHFQSVEKVKAETANLLKITTPNEPQHRFER
ncbi:uncharacterized protein TNCV_493651 [Trichonephila clavipes]|nr:uncharacterized protein TNCV_493651 [Trichonephila clavipes]